MAIQEKFLPALIRHKDSQVGDCNQKLWKSTASGSTTHDAFFLRLQDSPQALAQVIYRRSPERRTEALRLAAPALARRPLLPLWRARRHLLVPVVPATRERGALAVGAGAGERCSS